jgi:hypothetical protein
VLEDRSAPPVAGHELGRVATVLATELALKLGLALQA